jgi:hypothetical protein
MKQKTARIHRHAAVAAVAAVSAMRAAREVFDMPSTADAGEDKRAQGAESDAGSTTFGDSIQPRITLQLTKMRPTSGITNAGRERGMPDAKRSMRDQIIPCARPRNCRC